MRRVLGKENSDVDAFPLAGSNGDGRGSIQVQRAKSVPAAGDIGARPKKGDKKDYHWLMWKTTPTPVCPTPAGSAPKTPAPPMTPGFRPPSSRARSVVSRAYTPSLTPAFEDAPLSPDPFRTPTGPPPERRGFTPAPPTPAPPPCRIPTPMSLQPEYHDNMASPQMFPTAKYNGNSRKEVSEPPHTVYIFS